MLGFLEAQTAFLGVECVSLLESIFVIFLVAVNMVSML